MTRSPARTSKSVGGWPRSGSCPLIFLASLAVLFIAMNPALNLYDEGLVLVGAERVHNGEVPYRDFWTMYGPGQFYLTSLLYGVFGVCDLALRFSDLVAKAAIATLAFVITGRLASTVYALAAALGVLLLLSGMQIHGFPVFPALALALASIYCLDRGLNGNRAFLVAAGVCAGLETAFRHDLGAYTAAASVAVLAGAGLASWNRNRPGELLRVLVSGVGAYAVGLLLVAGPVAALLAGTVSFADLYHDLIEVPAKVYPEMRSLPFPGMPAAVETIPPYRPALADYAVYFPFLVVVWVIVVEWRRLRELRSRGASWSEWLADGGGLIAALVLMNVLFTLKGLVRVSAIHMVQSLVLSIMIVAIEAGRLDWRQRSDRLALIPALAFTAMLMSVPCLNGLKSLGKGLWSIATRQDSLVARCLDPALPRLRCVSLDADTLAAASFIMSETRDGDAIYVGAGRHDRLFVNAIALYFASERRPATKWHELHPGIQTGPAVQAAMVAELNSQPVRFLLLDERWDKIEEPNGSRLSSGVSLLDDYIRANFTEVRRLGSIRVLARRTLQ